jgi:hypothetical protein
VTRSDVPAPTLERKKKKASRVPARRSPALEMTTSLTHHFRK